MNRSVGVAAGAVGAAGALAALVALVATAVDGDRDCQEMPDARAAGVRHEVCGPLLDRYRAEGGSAGLGLPVSDERPTVLESVRPYGDREMAFSRGTVYLDSDTGETGVGRWESSAPLGRR